MNNFPSQNSEAPKTESSFRLGDTIRKVADLDFHVTREQLLKNRNFLAYVFLLMVLYIFNSHQAENSIRRTNKLQSEIKDLRSEYVTLFKELMVNSRQSSVAANLEATGLKELKSPPHKIYLNEHDN